MLCTEDDTFRILRRLPYEDLRKGLFDIAFSMSDRDTEDISNIAEIQDFCNNHNWTVEEFEEEFNKEQRHAWLKTE